MNSETQAGENALSQKLGIQTSPKFTAMFLSKPTTAKRLDVATQFVEAEIDPVTILVLQQSEVLPTEGQSRQRETKAGKRGSRPAERTPKAASRTGRAVRGQITSLQAEKHRPALPKPCSAENGTRWVHSLQLK